MPTNSSIMVPKVSSVAAAPRLPVAVFGWALVLALFPVLVFWYLPGLQRTSGSTDPQIQAVFWASLAVAVRAVIALLCKDRSWSWVIYVLAYPALLLIAGAIAEWRDFSPLWR